MTATSLVDLTNFWQQNKNEGKYWIRLTYDFKRLFLLAFEHKFRLIYLANDFVHHIVN